MALSRFSDLPHTPDLPPRRELPTITEISYGLKGYNPPVQRFTGIMEVASYREGVEFRIKTDREIPIQATSPALFIGNRAIIDFELTEPLSYTFFVFDPRSLPENAPIFWGWPGDSESRTATRFQYNRNQMQRF